MTEDVIGVRIALLGPPGSGKSTTAALFRSAVERAGGTAAIIKIAAPLYDVQGAFYARLGTGIREGDQDGPLLNFLGSHFRRVSPQFLLEDFERRCVEARRDVDAIICDDARPIDLEGLRRNGFTVVRVRVPDVLRRYRKLGRSDRVAGDDAHVTEVGTDLVADFEIGNAGTMADLESSVQTVLDAVVATDRVAP
jgi:hypothetical protein